MINCEICNDWFHGTCVSLEESDEPLIDCYICPICTAKGKGKTSWIRKCRLDGCKNPAIQAVKGNRGGGKGARGSKYCSDEHAIEFFKTSNPSDEFFLVQFNDRPELNVGFTTDTDKIQSALTFTQSKGRTALRLGGSLGAVRGD